MSDNISIAPLGSESTVAFRPEETPGSTMAFQAVHESERGRQRAAQRKAIVEAVRRMLTGRAARQLSR